MSKRNNFFGSKSGLTARTVAFLAATGITDTTIANALNAMDLSLIANGIDTKIKALYPFVGGTATTHKFNFMNAANTDAAFRLTFAGGWTHSATGAKPNGTTGVADPHYILSTEATVSNFSYGIYSRTNDVTGTQVYGCANAGFTVFAQHNLTAANMFSGALGNVISYSASPSTRTFIHRRTASNFSQSYRDGTSLGSETVAGAALDATGFYFGARNGNIFFTVHELAFGFLGGGGAMSNTDAGNFRTIIDTLQSSLSRNV